LLAFSDWEVRVTNTVQASDGRRLAVRITGHPDGSPVFLLHGTPGSRVGPQPRGMVLYRLGIRLISFDRPGYGHSDRLPGRRVADVAKDVAAIADAYGVERFAVVGRSGGGPHALACAALLPHRVTRAAVLVGLAPPTADGLDWLAGMAASNIVAYTAGAAGEYALAARLLPDAEALRADPAKLLAQLRADLPEPDRQVMTDPGIRARLVASHAEALRASAHGWVDDVLAFLARWGFSLDSVTIPVLVWHGDRDVFSPVSHAVWLATRMSSSTVIVQAGAAHFAAISVLPDVLRWLVSGRLPH
jgi:pimeloyl-ACP methyl ester carboxylesterase